MSEVERILDQIHRGFEGHAWHGPSVMATLKGVTVKQAAARPVPGAHSIHEIVPHIGVWKRVVTGRLMGQPWKPSPEENSRPSGSPPQSPGRRRWRK